MADEQCPNCGGEIPSELGQHSLTPMTGRANCPYCGAEVNVPKVGPGTAEPTATGDVARAARSRPPGENTFAGNDTFEDLRREVEGKRGGGQVR